MATVNPTFCPKTFSEWKPNNRVRGKLKGTGFDKLHQPNYFKICLPLIAKLMEHYDKSKYAFKFIIENDEEYLHIGLLDILYITGLPINGKPVIGKDENPEECCVKYLGENLCISFVKNGVRKYRGNIKLTTLKNRFSHVPDDVEEEQLDVYVRAYALHVIGCFIASQTTQGEVPVAYLQFLKKIDEIGTYAWGAALLASLHFSMQKRVKNLGGNLGVLQIFALEHMPSLFNTIYGTSRQVESEFPLIKPWTMVLQDHCFDTRHILERTTEIGNFFHQMTADKFVWDPYSTKLYGFKFPAYLRDHFRVGWSETILFCFNEVAWHHPSVNPRQLGFEGQIDDSQFDIFDLKSKTKGGAKGRDWATKKHYCDYLKWWDERFNKLITNDFPIPEVEEEGGRDEEMEGPIERQAAAVEAAPLPDSDTTAILDGSASISEQTPPQLSLPSSSSPKSSLAPPAKLEFPSSLSCPKLFCATSTTYSSPTMTSTNDFDYSAVAVEAASLPDSVTTATLDGSTSVSEQTPPQLSLPSLSSLKSSLAPPMKAEFPPLLSCPMLSLATSTTYSSPTMTSTTDFDCSAAATEAAPLPDSITTATLDSSASISEQIPPQISLQSSSSLKSSLAPSPKPEFPIQWPLDGKFTLDWIHNLMACFDWSSKYIPPSEFSSVLPINVFDSLILLASKILRKEPNCVTINPLRPNHDSAANNDASTVIVVGDVHGQLHDVLFLLRDAGYPADNCIIVFNGDYVDRGAWGLETFMLLLACKVFMPNNIYLLRGNHESKYCTSVYGFEKEVLVKYGDNGKHVYQQCLGCFVSLPLASIIAGSVYTTHGGLFRNVTVAPSKRLRRKKKRKITLDPDGKSLSLGSLEELSKARRSIFDPPWEGSNSILGDVLWSDPSKTPGLTPNKERGIGLLWGPDCTEEFLKRHQLKLIIRSHEGPDAREKRDGFDGMAEGYTFDHIVESGKLITLFSAPDYPQFQATEERYNNKGAYVVLEPPNFDNPIFHCFQAVRPRPKVNAYYNYEEVMDSDEELDSASMATD